MLSLFFQPLATVLAIVVAVVAAAAQIRESTQTYLMGVSILRPTVLFLHLVIVYTLPLTLHIKPPLLLSEVAFSSTVCCVCIFMAKDFGV